MKRSRTVIRELSRNESAKSLTASNLDSQWERTRQPAGLRSLPQSPSHTGDQATAVSSAGRGSIREKALGRWTTYWEEIQEQLGWRRKWQPTPVLLLGEPLGQRSLVGYSLWSRRVGHDWVTNTHTNCKWQLTTLWSPLRPSHNHSLLGSSPSWPCPLGALEAGAVLPPLGLGIKPSPAHVFSQWVYSSVFTCL